MGSNMPRIWQSLDVRFGVTYRVVRSGNADAKAEAVRIAQEFIEIHRRHWPQFEGETEVRPMFDPCMGP